MPTILKAELKETSVDSALSGRIKSIQRGVGSGASDNGGAATVNISQVDPSRCVVLITHGKSSSSFSQTYGFAYLSSMSSTQLNVLGASYYYSSGYVGTPFTWQVVEYE